MFRAAFEPTSCALALSLMETACLALLRRRATSPPRACPRAKVWLKRADERQHDLVLDAALGEAADFLSDSISSSSPGSSAGSSPGSATLILFGMLCCCVCVHFYYQNHARHYLRLPHAATVVVDDVKRRGTRTLVRARRLILLLNATTVY